MIVNKILKKKIFILNFFYYNFLLKIINIRFFISFKKFKKNFCKKYKKLISKIKTIKNFKKI